MRTHLLSVKYVFELFVFGTFGFLVQASVVHCSLNSTESKQVIWPLFLGCLNSRICSTTSSWSSFGVSACRFILFKCCCMSIWKL